MKNIYKIISILLVSVMLLCSCSTVVETQVQPTEEVTPTPTVEPTPMPTKLEDIGQVVYAYSNYHIGNNEIGNEFMKNQLPSLQVFMEPDGYIIENDVEKNITWTFLDVELTLEYLYSGRSTCNGFSDVYVDVYKSTGTKKAEVHFLHGTKNLTHITIYVNNNNYKMEHIKLENEEDYLQLISKVNDEFGMNYDNHDISCEVTYEKINGDKEIFKKLEDVKNTGRSISNFKIKYLPQTKSEFEAEYSPYYRLNNILWSFNFIGTDLTSYKEEIDVSPEKLDYAYNEVKEFAKNNWSDYAELSIVHTPSKTTVDILNGKLYLVIHTELFVHWNEELGGSQNTKYKFYVDYERLQWKMALDKKT